MVNHKNKRYTTPFCSLVRAIVSLSSIVLLSLSTPVTAGNQDTNTLRQSAVIFLQDQMAARTEQDIEITVGRIDHRLKLTACGNTPTPFITAGAKLQGKLTVGLRCTGPKPWTVYIPAQIRIFSEVIAAAHPLLRGTEISEANIMLVRQELSQLRGGYYTKSDIVIGKILKQNLASGQVITPKRIKAKILVHRGEKVTIVATMGTLKVRGKGEALRDAARGELVSVRNSRSKRIVQGVVTKPGTVNVQM